ncbi:MAG: D-sedoheptulose 7-phosphate isomerase [Acidobacteriota bacterium]
MDPWTALERELTSIRENLALQERQLDLLGHRALQAAERIRSSLAGGGKVLLFGNGGSAADAQHWAAELTGRYLRERPGLAAIALTTDTSALTAIANDYGYERVFARQVEALARPGDVAVGISTSGHSPNVRLGLQEARRRGCFTLAVLGRDGGALAGEADLALVYPAEATPRIQEMHAVLGHLLCALVEGGTE